MMKLHTLLPEKHRYILFCAGFIICFGLLSILNEFPRFPKQNTYFFNGKTYTDAGELFRSIESLGARDSLYRMEFAYEDYLTRIPDELQTYRDIVSILSIVRGTVNTLPDWIDRMPQLTYISTLDQPVTALPETIGNLSSLQTLQIGGGKLGVIPESISTLRELTALMLYDNNLVTVPAVLGSLGKLTVLDLHGNPVTDLPDSISNLNSLRYLYLGGNRIPDSRRVEIQKLLPETRIFF